MRQSRGTNARSASVSMAWHGTSMMPPAPRSRAHGVRARRRALCRMSSTMPTTSENALKCCSETCEYRALLRTRTLSAVSVRPSPVRPVLARYRIVHV
eukprot:919100-Prymnesium_polylepis.1